MTPAPITPQQGEDARAWIMAVRDQLAAAASVAARAGDRFAGTDLLPAFQTLCASINDFTQSSPAMTAARQLAFQPLREAEKADPQQPRRRRS